jgi:hypothetical protein
VARNQTGPKVYGLLILIATKVDLQLHIMDGHKVGPHTCMSMTRTI